MKIKNDEDIGYTDLLTFIYAKPMEVYVGDRIMDFQDRVDSIMMGDHSNEVAEVSHHQEEGVTVPSGTVQGQDADDEFKSLLDIVLVPYNADT